MPKIFWNPTSEPARFSPKAIGAACQRVGDPLHLVLSPDKALGVAFGGTLCPEPVADGFECIGWLPAIRPEDLGSQRFLECHGVRFPYVAGAMAHGIASVDLVVAMAKAGMLAFFGTGGLPLERIESGLTELRQTLSEGGQAWGANLIHSPDNPDLEQASIDLYLEHDVRRVSASAYMRLTPSIVQFASKGLTLGVDGQVIRQRHVMAKLSRPRVARQFLSPAPSRLLDGLVSAGRLTPTEADLASRVPVAEDVTVEADSGGHTDNRPLTAILPPILQLRDQLAAEHAYVDPPRIGAAGGLGTPGALAAAFALGAEYVLVGSVHQGTVESGLSNLGKEMLAAMDVADAIMAPSPDMFEQGIRVQVLKRGTLFAGRARRLYELYQKYEGLEELPEAEIDRLEKEIFRLPLAEVWRQTRDYLSWRNPRELARAEKDPKQRMARVFRWYVGKSSHWAVVGDGERKSDYQIWSGPSMGAFNLWVKGSFLEDPARRNIFQVSRNLLAGAAEIQRAQQLRSFGLPVPAAAFEFRPRFFTMEE